VPLPLVVGKLNKAGLNHLTRPLMRHLPGFAVVHHRGRRSGREYQTPVNLFRVGDRLVIALTYGRHTDWVRNVVAAGGCTIQTRGRLVRCTRPRVYRDIERRGIRPVERAVLGLIGVEDFLELVPSAPRPATP
jgi:deazaflavin-dependent oxidoreductase (nitroreductase family)